MINFVSSVEPQWRIEFSATTFGYEMNTQKGQNIEVLAAVHE